MPAITTILADTNNQEYWGHMGGWGGGWMWLWGVAMMALFVVLIVWGLRASTDTSPHPPASQPADRARWILAERYAKGDLDTAEYRERESELR